MVTTVSPIRPPSPKGHFIRGHLPELRRDWIGFLTACARDYGGVVLLRFGNRTVYFVAAPDAIETVLVTKSRDVIKNFALRKSRTVLGNGLLTSEGDFWRRQRRLMQPAFHRQRIAGYGTRIVEMTEQMLESWKHGQVRDIHADMMELTLYIISKTVFDVDVRGMANTIDAALSVLMDDFTQRLSSPILFLVPSSVPLPANLRVRAAVQQLDTLIYRIINERRTSGEDRGDLLSMLLHAQDEDDGSQMSDTQLRDEVFTLMLAGHETTALALSWAWYLLAQNPVAETRLHEELQSVLNDRVPTMDDLPHLHYTEMVILETMRLYPPSWLIGREAMEPFTLGDYDVPVGTTLFMSQWVTHRNPQYFEQPEAFRPERWADGLAKRIPKYAYFPFGGGPRLCIGNHFAMMEATLALATIAQRFQFRLVEGYPIVVQPSFTLRPQFGVQVHVHARDT